MKLRRFNIYDTTNSFLCELNCLMLRYIGARIVMFSEANLAGKSARKIIHTVAGAGAMLSYSLLLMCAATAMQLAHNCPRKCYHKIY